MHLLILIYTMPSSSFILIQYFIYTPSHPHPYQAQFIYHPYTILNSCTFSSSSIPGLVHPSFLYNTSFIHLLILIHTRPSSSFILIQYVIHTPSHPHPYQAQFILHSYKILHSCTFSSSSIPGLVHPSFLYNTSFIHLLILIHTRPSSSFILIQYFIHTLSHPDQYNAQCIPHSYTILYSYTFSSSSITGLVHPSFLYNTSFIHLLILIHTGPSSSPLLLQYFIHTPSHLHPYQAQFISHPYTILHSYTFSSSSILGLVHPLFLYNTLFIHLLILIHTRPSSSLIFIQYFINFINPSSS